MSHYQQNEYKAFDPDKRHLTTQRKYIDTWVKCKDCCDKHTCLRTERHSSMTCEAGMVKDKSYYWRDEARDLECATLTYKANL